MAHPGGNTTGFTAFEYSISGKWLELLKELAPGLTRVAVVREPSYAAGIGQFAQSKPWLCHRPRQASN
jgi:putative tryptophan/tyrosine transport system substrate-binding protein